MVHFIRKIRIIAEFTTIFTSVHNVNSVRFNIHSDFFADFVMLNCLYHPYKSAHINKYFKMNSFKCYTCYFARQGSFASFFYNFNIFRPYNSFNKCVFTKSAVKAFKCNTAEWYKIVFNHNSINYIWFAYKVCYKSVYRFVINILRRTYLLNFALVHNNNGVWHWKCFFLVMSNINKCYSKSFLNCFKFGLHIFSKL